MAVARYKGMVLAESDDTVVVEGNHYFPPESVRLELFADSDTHTLCPWKGVARYRTLSTDDAELIDVAWHYPKPLPLARKIKGRVAFDRRVDVEAG